MRRTVLILLFSFFGIYNLPGQKLQFGIQYNPVQASMISFDRDYLIFNDYTSMKVLEPAIRPSLPSLSNSGLFLRYCQKQGSFQTGINFQSNVYFYGRKTYDYLTSYASLFYSSIDIPFTATITLWRNAIVKYRLTAGVNSKIFKIRRNYYSIISRRLEYFNYAQATASDEEKRNFMIDKVNPFIVYFRSGIGIEYYNVTADLFLDRNITPMNKYLDKYNANCKNTYQINLALGFSIAQKDLKIKKYQGKINKE